MGCDIHMFVEFKCGNGMPWQADEHHFPVWESRCKDDKDVPQADWCDRCQNEEDEDQKYCDAGYLDYSRVRATGRDYQLFGLLAGVRSAGPDPRGLPDDVSAMIKAAADRDGSDGHSHSWISLEDFRNLIVAQTRYPITASEDAFMELDYPGGYKDHPPDYTTLINYCEKLKQRNSVDKHILGEDVSSEVQVRLVYWFDN